MILMIGIPGSGKSTFCQRCFPQYQVISLDLLHTRHQEDTALQNAIFCGVNCVIDNTNVTRAERAKYIAAAKATRYFVTGYYFCSKIDECLARNAQRSGKARIPDIGVLGRAKQLELPGFDEGFDELYYVSIRNGKFIIRNWEK